MDYIYIFINSAFPDYVLIGESSDYNKSLGLLNDLNVVPIPFKPFLTYQKPYNYFSLDLYFHSFSTGLSVFPIDATYYKISKEDAYKYLLDIASHYNNENDLVLLTDIEEAERPSDINNSEMSETFPENENINENNEDNDFAYTYSKNDFVNMFREAGYELFSNVTYASLVKSGRYYWPSPLERYFNEDWSLILNDSNKKQAHLFNIKAYSIPLSKMKLRNDEKHRGVVFMTIKSNDSDYTDPSSGIKFRPFLIATLNYDYNPKTSIAESNVVYSTNKNSDNSYVIQYQTNSNSVISSSTLKKIIIKYLKELGYVVHGCASLSSLNKNGLLYWSNPPAYYLKNDWTFFINERRLRKIYLFEIKANTLQPSQMRIRNDNSRHDVLDIEIKSGNNDFIDSSSGISFKQFMVAEIDYNDELNKIADENNAFDGESKNNATDESGKSFSVKNNIHSCNLASLINICYSTIPLSVTFLGNKYSVNHWSEVITIVMENLYNYDPVSLRKLSHSKSFSKFLCVNKILINGQQAGDGYKEIFNSGIFYYNDVDGAYDSRFLDFKKCVIKFGFTDDDLLFEYKYDDSDYIARHNNIKIKKN